MTYSLGLDGGGTKTECVVLNADDVAVGEGGGGPANPLRSGYETALPRHAKLSAAVLTAANARPGDIVSVCAGLAGAGRRSVVRRVMAFLSREFPGAVTQVSTDYEIALEAAVSSGPGVVLIAGTGSAAYDRNATTRFAGASQDS